MLPPVRAEGAPRISDQGERFREAFLRRHAAEPRTGVCAEDLGDTAHAASIERELIRSAAVSKVTLRDARAALPPAVHGEDPQHSKVARQYQHLGGDHRGGWV